MLHAKLEYKKSFEGDELFNTSKFEEKDISIDLPTLEQQIAAIKYNGMGLIREDAAENTKLPPFVQSFYWFLYNQERIPTPEELIAYYFHDHRDEFVFAGQRDETVYFVERDKDGNDLQQPVSMSREGLEAHIQRAYPSILRDFHFLMMALDSHKFNHVYYGVQQDYLDGIDLKVDMYGKIYNVALYQNSARSLEFKSKKAARHEDPADLINVLIDRKECRKIGDFWMYSQDHIQKLSDAITAKADFDYVPIAEYDYVGDDFESSLMGITLDGKPILGVESRDMKNLLNFYGFDRDGAIAAADIIYDLHVDPKNYYYSRTELLYGDNPTRFGGIVRQELSEKQAEAVRNCLRDMFIENAEFWAKHPTCDADLNWDIF